jgi:3-deoxy-manno-octulosonate cytidylyltransferase (CMP-KDO synthetase)
MNILCVIPSRIASTRLHRKPLALIQGKPMIQRVYEKAIQCRDFSDVVVATDSEEIANLIRSLDGKVVMTDPQIKTGSDRVAAVAEQFPNANVVVNLQGDEPFVRPEMLSALVAPYLAGETPEMTTLACPLNYETEYTNPNFVKVLINHLGYAMYFSRSPIPHFRQQQVIPLESVPVYHHQGVYAFRRDFLDIYKNLSQTSLEIVESLEQLRVLENGYAIKVCVTPYQTLEINTEEELILAQKFVQA